MRTNISPTHMKKLLLALLTAACLTQSDCWATKVKKATIEPFYMFDGDSEFHLSEVELDVTNEMTIDELIQNFKLEIQKNDDLKGYKFENLFGFNKSDKKEFISGDKLVHSLGDYHILEDSYNFHAFFVPKEPASKIIHSKIPQIDKSKKNGNDKKDNDEKDSDEKGSGGFWPLSGKKRISLGILGVLGLAILAIYGYSKRNRKPNNRRANKKS